MRSEKVFDVTEDNLSLLEDIVEIKYDTIGPEDGGLTIAGVAEEADFTGSNGRKVKERLSKLAIELFGYGIEM